MSLKSHFILIISSVIMMISMPLTAQVINHGSIDVADHFKDMNGKRSHKGKVTSVLISKAVSGDSASAWIDPMDKGPNIKIGVKIDSQAKRLCATPVAFESISMLRKQYTPSQKGYSSDGKADATNCVNGDGSGLYFLQFDTVRLDAPGGLLGFLEAPESKIGLRDGFILLNIVADGEMSFFRIDSPYFTKDALNKDPLRKQ
jgi:hypothetical protein